MSATPYTYTLSPLAYALPLLHAARYTSNTVLGLLLGSVNASEVVIDDAVPLLHNYTSLSPMAEAGLSLTQEEAKRRGLKVVGVYVVHELEVAGLGRVGERILDGLKKGFEGAVGLTVDNTKLGAGTNPYTFHTGPSAKPLSEGSVAIQSEEVLVKGTLDLIRRDHTHRLLVDFDDHLEDPEADWVGNAQVKDAVKRTISA